MNKKSIVGLVLAAAGFILVAAIWMWIKSCLPTTGQWAGKITMFREPFHNAGILMIWGGIAGLLMFLIGIILFFLGRQNR